MASNCSWGCLDWILGKQKKVTGSVIKHKNGMSSEVVVTIPEGI